MRQREFILLMVLGMLFLFGGCGLGQQEEVNHVRYIEEAVELLPPLYAEAYGDMAQEGNKIRLADPYGQDLISRDGGSTFVRDTSLPAATNRDKSRLVSYVTATGDGSRVLSEYVDGVRKHYLINGDGLQIEIVNPEGEGEYPYFYYGGGFFYFNCGSKIYQGDPADGQVRFLLESSVYPSFIAADETMLYVVHDSGVLLYDLSKEQVAGRQDEVLSEFLAGKASISVAMGKEAILHPYGEGVYILTQGGLYWHELYGASLERVIDSTTCSISANAMGFVKMAIIEKEEEEKPSFLVYYGDGSLTRYTYDPDFTFSQENYLRIYSVYEEDTIRRAVSAFRQAHPELYVEYEVAMSSNYGMTSEDTLAIKRALSAFTQASPELYVKYDASICSNYGMTLEDALRNLSTEIAAGQGPDILVMDDIPYASYVEKGVLMDLSGIRENLQGNYFGNVLDGLASEEGLYAMPTAFALPVIAADKEWAERLEGIQSLLELADLLEAAKAENGEMAIMAVAYSDDVLKLLAQSSMGAWLDEDRKLDREAVTEFLTQAKRIYDVQLEEVPDRFVQYRYPSYSSFLGVSTHLGQVANMNENLHRRFQVNMNYASLKNLTQLEAIFYAGYLELDGFIFTNGTLQYREGDLFMLPGQRYNTYLPTGLLAINSATKNQETARMFLEYVLSEEFQGSLDFSAFPVNEDAYPAKQRHPWGERGYELEASGQPYMAGSGYSWNWPGSEDFARLDSLISSLTGINMCENRVYETVLEKGQDVLKGELSVEEAVDAIERDLRIYLAE